MKPTTTAYDLQTFSESFDESLDEQLPAIYDPHLAISQMSRINPFSHHNRERKEIISKHKELSDVGLQDRLSRITHAHHELKNQAKKWKQSYHSGHEKFKMDVNRAFNAKARGFETGKILKTETTFHKQFGPTRGPGRPPKDEPIVVHVHHPDTGTAAARLHQLSQDVIDVPYTDITHHPHLLEPPRERKERSAYPHISNIKLPRLGEK